MKTKKLTTCALLVATATVLVWLSKLIPAPWLQGGSVTLASGVPIIIASLLFGVNWGISASLVFAVIQMMTGFYPPPTQSFSDYVLVIFLDYILAFGVFGIASIFRYKKIPFSIPLSGFIVTVLRYVCHIFSGLLIWGVYAEEGQSVLVYSLVYNGTYMIPEIIITTGVLILLSGFISKIENKLKVAVA